MQRDRLRIAVACGLYAALLLWLMRLLPFWLDEILQLVATTRPSFAAFLDCVRTNPGSVPLGYLLQFWLISTFGLGLFTARLPSVLASVLGVLALAALARESGVRNRTVLVVAFMVLPIQLRYAVEGRIYSYGMLFAILATWCLLRLDHSPGWGRAAWYALAVAASFYSQGFAALIQPGQVLSLAAGRRWRSFAYAASGLAVAALLFVPWYAWSKSGWNETITRSEFRFQASPRVLLALVREISGDGWAASLPLLAGAVVGFRRIERRTAHLLAWGVASGVVLGLAADYASSYFFAIRQFMYIVPGLLLLSVYGLLEYRRSAVAGMLVLLFLGGSLFKNYGYFHEQREDWVSAARLLRSTAAQGYCIAFVPKDEPRLYSVFEPPLERSRCSSPPSAPRVALATSFYISDADRKIAAGKLIASGYLSTGELSAGGTTITLYRKAE
jgi:4-amino-4-deoxy-L-arabinose transferase-like glycosyltransferase